MDSERQPADAVFFCAVRRRISCDDTTRGYPGIICWKKKPPLQTFEELRYGYMHMLHNLRTQAVLRGTRVPAKPYGYG